MTSDPWRTGRACRSVEPVSPEDVVALRQALGLTQADLAQLLGVHAMTVSRWERAKRDHGLVPSDFCVGLMRALSDGARRCSSIGEDVRRALAKEQDARALYLGLHASFGEQVGAAGGSR